MSRAIGIVLIALCAQVSLGLWVPTPWLMPDLVLLAVLQVATTEPCPGLATLVFVGGAIALATRDHPWLTGTVYAMSAFVGGQLSRRVDLVDARLRLLFVGIVEAVVMGLALMNRGAWSLGLAGWTLVRVITTMALASVLKPNDAAVES